MQKYRRELISRDVEGYQDMSPKEQNNVKKMKKMNCGLHLMSSPTDSFCSTLKRVESNVVVVAANIQELSNFIKKTEPAAVR